MSVSKHLLMGGWYPRGIIDHHQRYRPSDSNENVDIKFSAHDVSRLTCIGYGRSRKVGKPNNFKSFGSHVFRLWCFMYKLCTVTLICEYLFYWMGRDTKSIHYWWILRKVGVSTKSLTTNHMAEIVYEYVLLFDLW